MCGGIVMTYVNKFTRAGYNGKVIICPQCNNEATVFHFAWSALSCTHCGSSVNKTSWRLT